MLPISITTANMVYMIYMDILEINVSEAVVPSKITLEISLRKKRNFWNEIYRSSVVGNILRTLTDE